MRPTSSVASLSSLAGAAPKLLDDELVARRIATRLFLTCWIVFAVHFSPNIVREIYPALALGDRLSYRVDEYAHLHPDLFEKEGYGWHIGNNPGASMVAAIPYAVFRPVIDRVVDVVQRQRAESGANEPPKYNTEWPLSREFYAEAWRRGLDVRFGLAALVMQTLCMAPCSALGVMAVFRVLRTLTASNSTACWLAILYAFGTPVLFRTGFLNQNMMLGHIAFFGFVALWNPARDGSPSSRMRWLLGGLTGGLTVLFDYSGVVFLCGLFLFEGLRVARQGFRAIWDFSLSYAAGAIGPIALLWHYQWQSFGNPFLPGQHWMPPVEWIELGYQGYGPPQWELLWALACDFRFGLFVSCPLFLLAVASPFVRGIRTAVPMRAFVGLLGIPLLLWLFFSGSNYTRLQFNTGIRYMAPAFPFLFVPAALVVTRLSRPLAILIAIVSVAEGWSLAMHRDVEVGPGVLNPVFNVFLGGFQLPCLTTLSRIEAYQRYFEHGASPLPIFLFASAVVALIWAPHLSAGARAIRIGAVNDAR